MTTFRTSHCSPSFEVAPNEDNRRTEMLASSMMLVAISEETPAHTGYNSSYSSMNSRKRSCASTGSGDSLSGWGNSMTRKSYKVDLSTLATESQTPKQVAFESSISDIDDWGFFDQDH